LEKLTDSPRNCVALLEWLAPSHLQSDADTDAKMAPEVSDGVALVLGELERQSPHARECLKVLQNVGLNVAPAAVHKMVRAGCITAVAAVAHHQQHAADAHLQSEIALTLGRLGRHLAPPAPLSMIAAHAHGTSLSAAQHKDAMATCIDEVAAHVSALLENAQQQTGPDGSRSAAAAAAALLSEALKNMALLIHRSDPWVLLPAASKGSRTDAPHEAGLSLSLSLSLALSRSLSVSLSLSLSLSLSTASSSQRCMSRVADTVQECCPLRQHRWQH